MINVANKTNNRISSHAMGIIAICMGVILVVVSFIGGTTLVIAFAEGVIGHTITAIREQIERLVFDFGVPLIGGIILVFVGLRVMNLDNQLLTREANATSKNIAVKQKEQMLNVFLSGDEKKVINLIKADPEGSLQSDLVIKTGYSKVKMHRILKSLENKGVIKRGRFGITNRVLINNS